MNKSRKDKIELEERSEGPTIDSRTYYDERGKRDDPKKVRERFVGKLTDRRSTVGDSRGSNGNLF